MQTKLSRYSEGLMEAVWLAAVIIVPIFFNVYSSRIFEPDKAVLLRSLTLLGVGAWIVKIVEQGRIEWGLLEDKANTNWFKSLLRVPLMPAVLSLVAAYIIATIFSVTPRVSFLGSYQRLQGTYTTLSYIAIFAMIAVHMRSREQVNRLVTTVVLASLPIGLYGIMQRFGIDSIPWGGDTTRRVAANMGNSIFLAAYLILAFPMAVGRIVDSFSSILDEKEHNLAPQIARGTIYVFIAAIQLIAIYYTFSRGPILGLLAGLFFLFVLLSLYWDKRWLTFLTVGLAAGLGVFLVVLSIPGGPLESLRSVEGIGRLGNVFETDEGTGRVRVLIWQGASEMMQFHEPLEFPDGDQDGLNAIRPFIGYGPESMYVAYNPFYPSELGNIEARNASPDRSHNETWDALVITGLFGLIAEQFVFISLFYYGLKWLGLLNSRRQGWLFLGLILGAGAVSSIGFATQLGLGFMGVGLPFGMLLGLLAYLTIISLFARYETPKSSGERARALTLIILLGAIIAHYVEIHFGIAIVATRLHFWVYSGVMLASGYAMTLQGAYGKGPAEKLAAESGVVVEIIDDQPNKAPKKQRLGRVIWQPYAWISGLIGGIILASNSYNFITNPDQLVSIGQIIRNSLVVLPPKNHAFSLGILSIFVTVWIAVAVVSTSEWSQKNRSTWINVFMTTAGVSLGFWLLFSMVHASGLISILQAAVQQPSDTSTMDAVMRQAARIESLLSNFGFFILLAVLWLARQLDFSTHKTARVSASTGRGLITAISVFFLVIFASWQANIRIIHADMAFKMADQFSRGEDPGILEIGLALYQRANEYAPQEDHYYLFLGRGYLELARVLQVDDPLQSLSLLRQARTDLERAQVINPLNTDHTANLARLHRFWGRLPNPSIDSQEMFETSSDYYARAVVLSPKNAVILNEWATLNLQNLNDEERGLELLVAAKEIDPFYHGTNGLLGDYYAAKLRQANDTNDNTELFNNAIEEYNKAISKSKSSNEKYLYAVALAGVHNQVNDDKGALEAYEIALENANPAQVWLVEDTIAKVYIRLQDYKSALDVAIMALEHAPEEQKPNQQQLIDFIIAADSSD